MQLLKSDEIKIKLLDHLKDRKWHSFYDIQRKCSINYTMLKKHVYFLEMLYLVETMKVKAEESVTGKGSYRVRITDRGMEFLHVIKDKMG